MKMKRFEHNIRKELIKGSLITIILMMMLAVVLLERYSAGSNDIRTIDIYPLIYSKYANRYCCYIHGSNSWELWYSSCTINYIDDLHCLVTPSIYESLRER